MTQTAYPDGSLMTSTALSKNQVETLFQQATCQMLGILTDPWTVQFTLAAGQVVASSLSLINLYSGQLVACPGLPDGTLITGVIGNNLVAFNNVATLDGPQAGSVTDPLAYSKVRIGWQQQGQPGFGIDEDICFVRSTPIQAAYGLVRDITNTAGDTTITQTDVFTRAWRTFWTFYGPNSLDNARMVRSGLMKLYFVDALLEASNLYVDPAIAEPLRVPELFQGEWWERVDLAVAFNEEITETLVVNAVASVEVIGYTKAGEFTDFTAELS